jgi:hypothetical protein
MDTMIDRDKISMWIEITGTHTGNTSDSFEDTKSLKKELF